MMKCNIKTYLSSAFYSLKYDIYMIILVCSIQTELIYFSPFLRPKDRSTVFNW